MKKYISISYISEFLNNLSETIKASKNTSKTKDITVSCKIKVDRNNGSLGFYIIHLKADKNIKMDKLTAGKTIYILTKGEEVL